ncbi:hypothetical protein FOC1_g10001333 [Fusarium oxysporum f. sp. cubense race 1]|uniref:Protein kinase domain-containing protein n=1 Tax=Fusarium oxysporum f. sp. cubense (strain race 1) TaxID=1229664 RepID=N4UJ97_FUSC1|nr:hypothetical protein FOC1_g10001333 [Fusarium oxysporum f. sp. cubense race 1]
MSFEIDSQNDGVAMESRQNIRAVATDCQSLFAAEVINNICISTHIRRAEHRFLLWASFLGVYADEQQCLDIRLQNSPETRNLILLMLQVLKRNLEHVIAEPYEIRTDNRKGPVYGIDGALDRLHRLAAVIQSEQTVDETRDVHRLNSKQVLAIDLWDTQAVVKLNQFSSTDDVRQHPSPLSNDQNTSKQVKSLVQIESPSPYLPNDTLAGCFRGEMDRVSIRGVNGNDEVVPYVPLSALEKYWTDERVIEVLNSRTINFPEVYEGHRGEARYNAEIEGYQELQKLPNDFIAKYFASFHFPEANRFVIVLEYAEDGSLTDYLETTLPPTTPEDVLLLWKSMFSLNEALDALTVVYQQNPRSPTFVGVHQDINPGNILVFPRGKGSSLFDVSFKLKDFGMAGTGAMSVLDKMIRFGNRRNRDYVSPEVFDFAIQGTGITAISQLTDTWSFGALFSDFLVWTMTGELGREAYRVKRNAEIPQIQQFPIAGYDCCFHDGKKRLKVIEDVHNEALECRRASDLISPAISDLILNHMLVESRDRLDAMQVRNYAANKLKEYQETMAIEPKATRSITMSLANQDIYKSSVTTEKIVTVEEVYQLILSKDRFPPVNRLFGTGPSISDVIMDLPGMHEARSKIVNTNGRRQIIPFDNFASMTIHREKAIKTARVISYVAKEAGPDLMKVYAASETPAAPIKCKNSTEVEAAIRKFNKVQGRCRLRKCLDEILNRVLTQDGFKPTSIYILTDGVWEPGEDEVKFAINRAINFLIEHRLPSSALMFQFVQFGNDQKGEANMRRLDDDYKMETENEV